MYVVRIIWDYVAEIYLYDKF